MTTPGNVISGQQSGALLLVLGSVTFWIVEILRWTMYYGKVAGSHIPDWLGVTWILILFGLPLVSMVMLIIVGLDKRERWTFGFIIAVLFGFSPLVVIFGHFILHG